MSVAPATPTNAMPGKRPRRGQTNDSAGRRVTRVTTPEHT
jgi:hypothetical protein